MSTVLTLLQELSRAAVRETGVLAVLAMRVCAYVCGWLWIATPLQRVELGNVSFASCGPWGGVGVCVGVCAWVTSKRGVHLSGLTSNRNRWYCNVFGVRLVATRPDSSWGRLCITCDK